MKDEIKATEAVQAVVMSQRKTLEKELDHMFWSQEIHVRIQQTIKAKLVRESVTVSKEVEMQDKVKQLDATCKDISGQIKRFVQEYFPPENLASSGHSLEETLQELINQKIEQPHSPYVRCNLWPPYLEMLIRKKIVMRHPTNCDLVKLISFNEV